MGLDFDYNHSRITIIGQSIAIIKRKKPHHGFTTWAMKYGPIFSIQVGSIKQVVITSPEIAKKVQIIFLDLY